MYRKAMKQATALAMAVGLAIVALSLNSPAQAFEVLHYFTGSPDGSAPYSQLTFDGHGNLFGTTLGGGGGYGTVFEVQPNGDGTWTESIIHDFRIMDGEFPVAGVAFDHSGALYGTTEGGSLGLGYAAGSIYRLALQMDGSWKAHTMHIFTGSPDGYDSQGALTIDNRGHIYGTSGGGTQNSGIMFELDQLGSNSWTYKIPYDFPGGHGPSAGSTCKLLLTSNGDLFGTSETDGAYGYGSIYKLHRQADGTLLRQSGRLRTVTCAASTSKKRKIELPCLVMCPSRLRLPLESSSGTRPR